jgi:hypothetical protein
VTSSLEMPGKYFALVGRQGCRFTIWPPHHGKPSIGLVARLDNVEAFLGGSVKAFLERFSAGLDDEARNPPAQMTIPLLQHGMYDADAADGSGLADHAIDGRGVVAGMNAPHVGFLADFHEDKLGHGYTCITPRQIRQAGFDAGAQGQ